MTGPEHFAEAERLLGSIHEPLTNLLDAVEAGEDITAAQRTIDHVVGTAQTHALLALAAATAYPAAAAYVGKENDMGREWAGVI